MHENYAFFSNFRSSHKFDLPFPFRRFFSTPLDGFDERRKEGRKEDVEWKKMVLIQTPSPRCKCVGCKWGAEVVGSRDPLFPDSHVSAPPTLHLLIRGTVRLFLKSRVWRGSYRVLFSRFWPFCVFLCFNNLL